MSSGNYTFRFEPVVQTISVLTASTFAIKVHEALSGTELGPQFVWALVLPLAAIVYGALDFLFIKLPLRFRLTRRLLSRTASIEGYWFEGVHAGAYPFSIVCIEYDATTNSYVYHGTNYRADGVRNASFRTVDTSVSDGGSGITFHFEATQHNWSEDVGHAGTDTARGYGVIRFFTEGSKAFVRGEGEFFERNPRPNWKTFELYRISTKQVEKVLGKRYATDDLDYERILLESISARKKKRSEVSSLECEVLGTAVGELESRKAERKGLEP